MTIIPSFAWFTTPIAGLSQMATQETTQVMKRELRKRIRIVLKTLPKARLQVESTYLTENILAHMDYKNANTIALYASLPTEMDTSDLVAHALSMKKRVFLPRVLSKLDREMAMLEVHSMEELNCFDKGAYSIPEPPLDGRARAPHDVLLDLVVVPGVAFDMGGRRCGHGMGYYDVFFSTYSQSFAPPMPKLVALALSPQVVDKVPTNDDDYVIDSVIAAPSDLPVVEDS